MYIKNIHLPQILFFVGAIFLIITACSSNAAAPVEKVNPLAPVSALPEEIKQAPQNVQEAYRFALANPEILKQMPCYCGCGAVGHKNNYQCYIAEMDEYGKPVFDNHALG